MYITFTLHYEFSAHLKNKIEQQTLRHTVQIWREVSFNLLDQKKFCRNLVLAGYPMKWINWLEIQA